MDKPRIYTIGFAAVYPLYVQKAQRKGRTQAEVDEVLCWLTGHTPESLRRAVEAKIDMATLVNEAPAFHPRAESITGVVCGIRVEQIEDATTRKIRQMDKLIDELAKGKPMAKILRG